MHNIKAILKSGVPLLLEGPTGVGKTYLIQTLATEMDADLYVVDVSGELTVDTLLGRDTLTDGTVRFVSGVLTQALENSHKRKTIFMANEFNTALPEVLTVMNGILDDQRAVTLPDAGNTRVHASDQFYFVATQNPANGSYAGTQRLNDALLNRMVKVTLGYLQTSEELEALKKHTKLSDSTVLQLVRLGQWTRENMDDPLSTRDLVKILRLKEGGGLALRDAIQTVALSRYSREEYARLYEYHSNIMSELRDITGGTDTDPFEDIKRQYSELKEKQRELDVQKADLKASVRKELLNDLLLGKDL